MKHSVSHKTHFIARYEVDGVNRSAFFSRSNYTQAEAEKELTEKGIKNFFFSFEPYEPVAFGENGFLFSGEIGFDITTEKLLPYLEAGNEIIIDSFGGDLWEGWKIHDAIKAMGTNPSIGVLGSCASAATMILLATDNRWATFNSRFLIHNPWMMAIGDDELMYMSADELKKEKNNIAKLYSSISGKSFDETLALMKEERFMGADEMLEFNFITQIKGEIKPKKDDEMNKEEIKAALDEQEQSLLSKIKAWIKPKSPKNAVFQDVNGVDIDFGEEIETLDQVEVGTTATIDGSPATGEHTMSNGNVYVFEAGAVTEITEAGEGDDLEAENAALKQEIEDLKAQNAAKAEEVKNLKAETEKVKADAAKDFQAVKADFEKFKNKFSDTPPVSNTPSGDPEPVGGFKFKRKK